MSTTVEREPEIVERPTHRPPPLRHLFRPRWWEIVFVPERFWRVREGEVALCGVRCEWTNPRGAHRTRSDPARMCVVCRDLSGRRP